MDDDDVSDVGELQQVYCAVNVESTNRTHGVDGRADGCEVWNM